MGVLMMGTPEHHSYGEHHSSLFIIYVYIITYLSNPVNRLPWLKQSMSTPATPGLPGQTMPWMPSIPPMAEVCRAGQSADYLLCQGQGTSVSGGMFSRTPGVDKTGSQGSLTQVFNFQQYLGERRWSSCGRWWWVAGGIWSIELV